MPIRSGFCLWSLAAEVLIHIAGDWLTDSGVPIPILCITVTVTVADSASACSGSTGSPSAPDRPTVLARRVTLQCTHLGSHDGGSLARWCGTLPQQLVAPFNRPV